MHDTRKFLGFSALLCALLLGIIPTVASPQKIQNVPAAPLVFEQNKGQVPAQYQFRARRNGMDTRYRPGGMDILFPKSKSATGRLRIDWIGASASVKPEGSVPLPGRSNYLQGNDSSRWVRGVPQFGRIEYGQIYPGIDLVYHGAGDTIEEDFIVEPGRSPSQIRMHFDRAPRFTKDGDLEISIGESAIRLRRPVAYQEYEGSRVNVRAKFAAARNGEVKFEIGDYDRKRALVIDPVFVFSTYLDGTGRDEIQAVTTDAAGNVYVTGATSSLDFPIVNGLQTVCNACGSDNTNPDVFISKLDSTGHTLLYSTYVGGSNSETGFAIALDPSGNIIVAGLSTSSNFPQAGSLTQGTCQINNNCFFVLSLNSSGAALNYSGLVGGNVGSYGEGNQAALAVDSTGNAYLAGSTEDSNFPLTPGTVGPTSPGPPYDAGFVTKFDPTGKIVYSTVIPGNAPQDPSAPFTNYFAPQGIAVDATGEVTVAGYGGVGLPTTAGVLKGTFPNNPNAEDPIAGFVLQLNSSASAFNYVTYIPGTDYVFGLVVDGSGNSYVTGETGETTLPVSANAFQKTLNASPNCSCNGGFIAKIDSQGKTMPAATYLSGASEGENTLLTGIALDMHSNVFVGGYSSGGDFPLKNPFMNSLLTSDSSAGAVVAQVSPDLSTLLFGSDLHAPDFQARFSAVTMDSQNNAIVVGTTNASDFPTTSGGFQTVPPGGSNPFQTGPLSFISKINLSTAAASVCLNTVSINFGTQPVNQPYVQNLSVENCGNAALQFSSISSSASTVTAAQSCGSIAPGTSCTVQLTFMPVDTNPVSGTVTLADNAAIPRQIVNFTGTGGVPQIFYPSSVTFQDLLVGTQATSSFSIDNEGTANYVITNAAITGDFSLASGCATPLGEGASCTVTVTFAPTQAGARTGTLTLTDNAPGSPRVIQLTGNGLASYPNPSITTIIAIPTDSQGPELIIFGGNFFPASQVSVNGTSRTVFYENETQLDANLTAADIAHLGELQVVVTNPTPGGGPSNTSIATVYAAIRNIGILQTVYEPISGILFASVSTTSQKYANQVVEINPATAQVLKAYSVGNGPSQLAVSDDGSMLYVGLNGDKKVAQVSLPTGTVNFTTAIGGDTSGPFVADALRVFPGHPHSWAVTLCGNYDPCGAGIAVFDDAVERPTVVNSLQLQPDSLLFVGANTTSLFGATVISPISSFYQFTINSSGITLTSTGQSFGNQPHGGGYLDTDGTSIYVSNGEVINPNTVSLISTIQGVPMGGSLKVDAPAAQIYFAGQLLNPPPVNSDAVALAGFGLQTQLLNNLIVTYELALPTNVFRYGTNGVGFSGGGEVFFFPTGMQSTSPQISLAGGTEAAVTSGTGASYALTVAPLGGFAGAVTFSCTNLPQYASCSFSPNGATISGAPVNFTAAIATSQRQAELTGPRGGFRYAGFYSLAVLGLLVLTGRIKAQRGSRGMKFAAAAIVLVLILLPLASCGGGSGGGGGGGGNPPPPLDTPKGSYTVNLVATGNGASQTIQLTLVVQ